MASTTTNLGLTKPAYSDDADISDINGNMDLIDAEAGRVRANVAANYDSSETYAVGDYCLHDGSLYKCSTAISSPEAWTAGHWTQIKITGELSALNGKITPEWHNVGDLRYGRSAGIAHVSLTGSVTLDTSGKIGNIPQGYRPIYNTYFFTTASGSSNIAPYLVQIKTDGDIIVYNRGDSVDYLYGSCAFTIGS